MSLKNMDIRTRLLESGIQHYRLAQELQMNPSTLSQRLKSDLSKPDRDRMMRAIDRMIARKGRTARQ